MLEMDDDPKTLCALLDALDETPMAQLHVQKSSEEQNKHSGCSCGLPAKKKRAVSSFARQRQRIFDLQQEIEQLEEVLKAQKRRKARSAIRREREELWKAIVWRQRRARVRAQALCVALRTHVDKRFRLDDDLARALLTQTRLQIPRPLDMNAFQTPVEEVFARLQHLSQHTHVAFAANCFNHGSLNFNHTEMVAHGRLETVIDSRKAWVVPFAVDDVHRSLWTFMERLYLMVPEPDYQADHQSSADSVVTSYFFPAKAGDPAYQAREITKNFCLSDGSSVIVSSFQADSMDSIDPDLSIYEVLWTRVRDVSSNDDPPLTQVQVSMRTIVRSEGTETLSKGVHQLMQALESESEVSQSHLEALLLTSRA
ncbi:hypothetical protein Poli38472_004937 [Pythium oligandrum]|uniref:Uncharacterized protein n=1 Tax=Pythium oligandrum TaxID=41045 RepID=A0A8K1CBC8_PYTOL|nr:hypothetical protein Poli38472_004937 [Pythium oligandrum]|eukprot:TMW59868.1 hypothetical protein Poli38472_004937 [Pythium oligandrum]